MNQVCIKKQKRNGMTEILKTEKLLHRRKKGFRTIEAIESSRDGCKKVEMI